MKETISKARKAVQRQQRLVNVLKESMMSNNQKTICDNIGQQQLVVYAGHTRGLWHFLEWNHVAVCDL